VPGPHAQPVAVEVVAAAAELAVVAAAVAVVRPVVVAEPVAAVARIHQAVWAIVPTENPLTR
jgi:hypothetical protein